MALLNVGTSRIAEIVGAQGVTVQAVELPQALATGVVNAFMSSGATGYDSKVWETLTHFYDTRAWIPKNVTFVNKAAFDGLDKPTQEAIDEGRQGRRGARLEGLGEQDEWYHRRDRPKGMKYSRPARSSKTGSRRSASSSPPTG